MPKAGPEPPSAAASLYQDEDSFRKPIENAIAACMQAFEAASERIAGAEARMRAAIDDLASLRAFIDAVESHMRAGSFHELPGFRRGRERLEGFRQLTVGPWRGVFLVDAAGTTVVGLVFSRHPHRLEERLGEIADRYRAGGGADDSSPPG